MPEKLEEIADLSFEDAIRKLSEVVNKIESGQTPLAASIEQYELGMGLIKHCRDILQDAEKKIEEIADESGEKE